MADLRVAETILEQLGGRRFITMTGARQFVGTERSLTFKLPSKVDGVAFARNGINCVQVNLDASDTYTVTFSRVRGTKVTEINKISDVYCEDLQRIFTDNTGLYTRL